MVKASNDVKSFIQKICPKFRWKYHSDTKLEPGEKYKKLKKYDDVNNLAVIVVAVVYDTLFDFPFCSGCHRQNTISFTAF